MKETKKGLANRATRAPECRCRGLSLLADKLGDGENGDRGGNEVRRVLKRRAWDVSYKGEKVLLLTLVITKKRKAKS